MGKVKLVLGIVLLLIGVGVLPTGYVLHNRIEEDLDLALPGVLLSIRDQVMPEIEKYTKYGAIPETMIALKNVAVPHVPEMVNGTISLNEITDTLDDLSGYIGFENATDWFFNDPAWTVNTDGNYSIQGISEYAGLGNLSFTPLALTSILSTFQTTYAFTNGIPYFLDNYEDSITDLDERDDMMETYNSTWEQLGNVSTYLIDYLYPLVPALGSLPYEATDATAEDFFFMQWANGTILPDSWEITLSGSEIEDWEFNSPGSNLSFQKIYAIWNSSNQLSPFNSDGIKSWIFGDNDTETAIQSELDISNTIYESLVSYFFDDDFGNTVMVPLLEYVQEKSIEAIFLDNFYRQWATGVLIPEGISSLGSQYALLEGFEVVLPPIVFNLPPDLSNNLWDLNNSVSLTNPSGIIDWLKIARFNLDGELSDGEWRGLIDDSIEFAQIQEEFTIGLDRSVIVSKWLLKFRYELAPTLLWQNGLFFMHPIDLSNLLNLGGLLIGGLCAFLGVILILSYRKR
ncbi:MAG: hypothetical protein JW776_11055 [Candidatus Lokiarchaeota archaeon]|nr:hypothetical protein [Candidatus Lokiarchaeota archaeon]